MDVSGAIDSLGNATLSVTRRGTPTLGANGRYSAGSTTPTSIAGVVVPATPEDVLLLPEGRRTERSIAVFTKEALQPSTVSGTAGDRITYQGQTFEVLRVEPWSEHGFWRSVAVKAGA